MKLVLFLITTFLTTAQAGVFLSKGAYVSKDLSIGFGDTLALAELDAKKAIPQGYKMDPRNSPAVSCAFKELPNDNDECKKEDVRVEMALIAQ